jgi:hypothetical protein
MIKAMNDHDSASNEDRVSSSERESFSIANELDYETKYILALPEFHSNRATALREGTI